ncbi:hypothetical protein [Nitrospira japonica]|uniref:hypothetical protein n=1 Tax=Nitrospira japonica TaxID=1325564 RepID=UPI0009BB8782|nr:hypothetical protein [Nitrospira japonica]
MNCERCGGFKVFDYFYGPLQCDGFRCVNCGAITDMRILTPRREPASRTRVKLGRTPLFAMAGVASANRQP